MIREFITDNPGLIDVLMMLVVWPLLTAVASLFQEKLAEKAPKLWGALQASGFDVVGLVRRLAGTQKPTETPQGKENK